MKRNITANMKIKIVIIWIGILRKSVYYIDMTSAKGVCPLAANAVRKRAFIQRTRLNRNWDLYLLLLLPIAYFAVFKYQPMYGLIIAFKNFSARKGILGSAWVGLYHFENFFASYYFPLFLKNTLLISLYSIFLGFPMPILLALSINEIAAPRMKKCVQTIVYMPHFLSVIVTCSLVIQFLSPTTGIINKLIVALGGTPQYFMAMESAFKSIYVLSDVWSGMGWNAIIYLAALSGIDPSLYESAEIDGANRWQRILYINLPGILPTVVITLILRSGSVMNVGYEKILLLQNELNYNPSEVISTYVYNKGVLQAQYSFSTAVGLFNNAINFVVLTLVNRMAKAAQQDTLW